LRNGRWQGEDCITADMIKVSVAALITFWAIFFATVWEKEKVPVDWKHSILIRLFRKGDTTDPGNW